MTKSPPMAQPRHRGPVATLLQALLFTLPAQALSAADVSAGNDPTSLQTTSAAQPLSFQLAAQPLERALTQFAEQSGMQVFYRPEELPAQLSTAVSGRYLPEAALQQLLKNTGLTYQLGHNGTLVIRGNASPREADPEPVTAIPVPRPPQALEETYVTGVRTSLRQSLAMKQASSNLIEVTTSEDIGKFPDHNVADALQRIAGVSVDRVWGEGRDVNIRGTDKDINRTLLNGQHVASAYWWANDNLSRGFNYSTLASQLVQSLEVHKTPRADLDEGSIGGTVIVRTRKPLEMDSGELYLSAGQNYSALADRWAARGSALGSWKNAAQSLGVLASLNWQKRDTRRDGLETFADNNLYTVTDAHGAVSEDVYAVWGGGSALLQQQRSHTTGNLTLQWAPGDRWDTTLNLLRSQVDIDNTNHNYLFAPGGYKLSESPPATVADPIFLASDDGRAILAGGTLGNPDSPGAILDAIRREAFIDTRVNDIDIRYRGNNWDQHVQFGDTSARGGTEHDRLYRFTGNTRVAFRLDRDAVESTYLDLNPEDAAALTQLSPLTRDWIRTMNSREHYAQWDLEQAFSSGWLRKLQFGAKVRNHRVENHLTEGEIDLESSLWPALSTTGLDQVSSGLSPFLSNDNATINTLTRYAVTDADLLASVIDPVLQAGAMTYTYDRSAFFRIREQSAAAYASLDLEAGAWSGNIGMRGVTTRQRASAYDRDRLHHVDNRYRDLLPSANLSYHFGDDLVARLGAAQVMARPNFKDLTPNIIIEPTSGNGAAGNPTLDPYRADQLDLGLEWYFADASLFSATLFYKDISTFVYPHVNLEIVDGESLYITRPQNGPGADIRGAELQWQQTLGGGFGVLSNYTYTDASVPSADGTRTLELPGNSRSQFNASLYFENARFNGRVSYNYRSRSYGEIIAGSQSETDAYRQWDATAEWHWSPRLSLSAEAINLTEEVLRIRSASGIPQGFYENGRRFALGVKIAF
ncbi:TonB-dependent receptor [Microbulbifer sp. YPW1]|uniref:TonB-dependent receptor n=1 Tax=Microbulbifer sp. YPW1 TaxID=2745199 RepID=UPI0015981FB5|nr:TonB-dependent receptor [Microbulbifer sp. YPW1]QKX15761.1 TonB-dependent receptor [Microbulbifer sp. YPW1]